MPRSDNIRFEVTWDGQQQGQLYYVIDNGRSVVVAGDGKTGRGRITVSYTVSASTAHVIKWSLWFPTKTLENLEATVSVNGGDATSLGSSDSEESRWAEQGTCTG